jgi:para-aminobenzoate synthetase/4-amino-4-deoxychorismate lyase
VAIRTVTSDAVTGAAVYGTGGGITWDSHATAEYDETVAKARVLTVRRAAFRLLETLTHEPGAGYRRRQEHLARMRASADYFGIPLDEGAVETALEREASRFPAKAARVRLLIDQRGGVEAGAAPLTQTVEPVRIAIDRDHPIDPTDALLFHKTTLRQRYEEAAERFPDADDVVLINTRGEVTETTRANVAAKIAGRWVTPPLDAGLLPGCEREALLSDGTLQERPIALEAFTHADEIAFLNSVRGWRRAVLLD